MCPWGDALALLLLRFKSVDGSWGHRMAHFCPEHNRPFSCDISSSLVVTKCHPIPSVRELLEENESSFAPKSEGGMNPQTLYFLSRAKLERSTCT